MQHDREIPIGSGDGTPGSEVGTDGEPSLGDLVRRLTTDMGVLVRQEIQLAKAEVREAGATVGRDAAKAASGFALAWTGMLAVTAALVIGLGRLIDSYWGSALIVGALFLIVGWTLARAAMRDVRRGGLAPDETIETLRDDAAWAKDAAHDFGRRVSR